MWTKTEILRPPLELHRDPKDLVITAANSFGKEITKILTVVGQTVAQEPNGKVDLVLDFIKPVVLGFTIDDQQKQTVNFSPGESKELVAQKQIVITTSDAGQPG